MKPARLPSVLLFLAFALSGFTAAHADSRSAHREGRWYQLETIPIPAHISLEVGGMEFMPDGRLMIATRRGEIWSLNQGEWKRFAAGLDEPMGIAVTGPHQIVAAQRPELTRITDTNGDGTADLFETLADGWNYTGHVYEWTFGPVQDRAGNLFLTLACWFFPDKLIETRPYSGWEIRPPSGYAPQGGAWRGWALKFTPGGELIPFASGLRSPNGLGFNSEGELFVTDNEGEYFGACVLHHVREGAFHGHPNSLFWGPGGVDDPFAIPLEELDQRRQWPAVVFPYRAMGQSASQPLSDRTGGKFGPFGGQWFVGDQTQSTVMRVALEKIEGQYQGACFPFRGGLQCGVNRLAFGPDGSLWIGQTDRGWGSVGGYPFGLQRLAWTGEVPFEIHSIQLMADGFQLNFTRPLMEETAGNPGAYSLQQYHYHYHRAYGSPQVSLSPVGVQEARLSPDLKSVRLRMEELFEGKIYEFHLSGIRAEDGSELLNPSAYYTLNRRVASSDSP
jgi:hypothetical protein